MSVSIWLFQISSPGYPYDASVPCDYFLSVDAGKRVQVEVGVVLCADWIRVNPISDTSTRSQFLLRLCASHWQSTRREHCCQVFPVRIISKILHHFSLTGALSNQTYTTHSSNFMRVSWQPDGGLNVRGMMVNISMVQRNVFLLFQITFKGV